MTKFLVVALLTAVISGAFAISGDSILVNFHHSIFPLLKPGVDLPNCDDTSELRIVSPVLDPELLQDIQNATRRMTSNLFQLVPLMIRDPGKYATTKEEILEDFKVVQATFLNDCLSQMIDAIVAEADEVEEELKEERMLRVVALIQEAQLGEAEVLYNQLNNRSTIAPILEALFRDPYDAEYREGLSSFSGSVLHTVDLRLEAYTLWLSLLQDNGALLENAIVILRGQIELLVAQSQPNPPEELTALRDTVQIYANSKIVSWRAQIRRGDVTPVANYGSPKGLHMVGYTFRDLMPELISSTYEGNPANFVNILKFIEALRWNVHKYEALAKLVELVQGNQDLLVITAYHIKVVMENLNGPDPQEVVQPKFAQLKASLPGYIQRLLWHSRCFIRNNVFTGATLYADEDRFTNPDNRKAFTMLAPSEDVSKFQLQPKVIGDTINFRVFNNGWPQHYFDQHTEGGVEGPGKYSVSFRTPETDYVWRMEIQNEAQFQVTFFHLGLEGYLAADTPDGTGRRGIFVGEKGVTPPGHVWRLDCDG